MICGAIVSLQSNQQPRFLAISMGCISESPTRILILSSFSSCCGVPINIKMAGICYQFFSHSGAFFQFILINLQFTEHCQLFNSNITNKQINHISQFFISTFDTTNNGLNFENYSSTFHSTYPVFKQCSYVTNNI